MANLRVHAILPSRANGPGLRTVLWVQGCTLACPGCWNPETHSFAPAPEPVETVLARLATLWGDYPPEGLTLSGGEPMQQPGGILALLEAIRRRYSAMSFGMFSGYTWAELEAMPLWPAISRLLDFAVLGRYDRDQPIEAPLRTSANQRLVFLSARYTRADFAPLSVEVTLAEGGLTTITGFPILGGIT